MPDYIPKANYPEGLASKVLELQSQRVNPWETLVRTVGKEGGKYFDKKAAIKKEKEDLFTKFEMDISKQTLNDVTEGKSMFPEGVKLEDIDPKDIYKVAIPNPQYRAFKTNTVNTDAQPAPKSMYEQYKKSFGDELEDGLTVGEVKALVNMHSVAAKQGLAESKDVTTRKQDRLDSYRIEGQSLTGVDSAMIMDPEQKKLFDSRMAAHKKEGIALGIIPKDGETSISKSKSIGKTAPDLPKLLSIINSKKLTNSKKETMSLTDVVKSSLPQDAESAKKLIKIHTSATDDVVDILYNTIRK